MTYEVKVNGSAEQRELPFVIGILGEFGGNAERAAKLIERRFVEVSPDSLDSCLRTIAPKLVLPLIPIALQFDCMDDFDAGKLCDQLGEEFSSLSTQVMETPEFLRLESAWRGLKYLLDHSARSQQLKFRILDVSKKELSRDFERALDFDRSSTFKKLHDDIFGVLHAEPFGVLIGDYTFEPSMSDMRLLEAMAGVAEAIQAPFVAAANAEMPELPQQPEATRWNTFRQSESSRYVCLTMPGMLLHERQGRQLWGNAAYALGTCIATAFAEYGWCARITGRQGGVVTGTKAETGIELWQENRLRTLGFITFNHHQGPSVGFAFAATCHKSNIYAQEEATSMASRVCALPFVLCVSRVVHYLRALVRDTAGIDSNLRCRHLLNTWIAQYVHPGEEAGTASYPFGSARVSDVVDLQKAGGLNRVALFIKPDYQMEPLSIDHRIIFPVNLSRS